MWLNVVALALYLWLGLPYVLYLLWMVLVDRDTPRRGGRRPVLRSWRLWRWFRDYFPAELVCEQPLDPRKTYVFGVHPHGVVGVAAMATMLNNFENPLAAINYRLVTLASNFWIPLTREWLLWLGVIGSDKKGIIYALEHGISVMIVVGGAAEALEIHEDFHGIVLDKRKGFVEIALRTGSSLVPVFNFGENELYHVAASNKPGTTLRRFQERMKETFGWTLPFVHGRGIWNYTFGFLPYRKPIVTVVGKPIPVEKIAHPTKEQVDFYHEQYKTALLQLHENWRVKVGETTKLKIIA